MATQKTLPTDASVSDFIDSATPAQRRIDGHELSQLFAEVTGVQPVMWGPSMIGYGQMDYVSPVNPRTTGIWPIVAFSPRKNALTLYGMKETEEMRALLPKLGTYTESVGCVYVKKLADIDVGVLKALVKMCWDAYQ